MSSPPSRTTAPMPILSPMKETLCSEAPMNTSPAFADAAQARPHRPHRPPPTEPASSSCPSPFAALTRPLWRAPRQGKSGAAAVQQDRSFKGDRSVPKLFGRSATKPRRRLMFLSQNTLALTVTLVLSACLIGGAAFKAESADAPARRRRTAPSGLQSRPRRADPAPAHRRRRHLGLRRNTRLSPPARGRRLPALPQGRDLAGRARRPPAAGHRNRR